LFDATPRYKPVFRAEAAICCIARPSGNALDILVFMRRLARLYIRRLARLVVSTIQVKATTPVGISDGSCLFLVLARQRTHE
jgi:hypothetical protein